uniref:Uncharacterized protein n=1 Tax=Trichogramma kaykai TaxID=54128 RepID=A0ABD2WST7_9HYME
MGPKGAWIVLALSITMAIRDVYGIYGYDCGTKLTNLTTLSLVDIGECESNDEDVQATSIPAKLIQINDYNMIHAMECKVLVKRSTHYCGMHSHTSPVLFGEIEYYKEVSRDECEAMHVSSVFNGFNIKLMNIARNSTTRKAVIFAGKIDKNSHCTAGEAYDDPYGSFTDVLVTGYVIVTIRDYDVKLSLENNKVILEDGTACNVNARQCVSGDAANVCRTTISEAMCGANKYQVMYELFVSKINDKDNKNVMYSLDRHEYSFALMKTFEESVCGITLIHTEVPRLLIVENPASNHLFVKKELAPANFDIFAFIIAKFLFLENHLKGQLQNLYKSILKE